jgi:long-chain fatty acid transport protein
MGSWLIRVGIAVACACAASGEALAGGFAIREQSATGQGMSFAGMGAGAGGLSSMFWNPAAITTKEGWNSEWHLAAILPHSSITLVSPTPAPFVGAQPGDIGMEALVPAGYSAYQINDRWWIGMSNTAPFGLATKPPEIWGGQAYSQTSRIVSFNFNPIVGFRINDWLSIAGGPMFEFLDVRLRRSTVPLGPGPSAILTGDDIGVGLTAGLLVTPTPYLRFGIGYRSAIDHTLSGSLTPAPVPGGAVPIRATVVTPEMVTAGLSYDFSPAWTVHFGAEWTNWSRLKTSTIYGGPPGAALQLNYDDGWFFSGGVEYHWNPAWTLRAGVAYEISPIDIANRGTRLPDTDRLWASLGATYKWNEKLSFDIGYSHIFTDNPRIAILPGHQDFIGIPLVANVKAHVDIISVAAKFRWDDPAPRPAVVKY